MELEAEVIEAIEEAEEEEAIIAGGYPEPHTLCCVRICTSHGYVSGGFTPRTAVQGTLTSPLPHKKKLTSMLIETIVNQAQWMN